MLEAFQAYIRQEKLAGPQDRILLAVSGGIDSMVMADLFFRSGIPYGIAHCNFQLRGKESEADEAFVRAESEKTGKEFFVRRFPTLSYAEEKGISIQMAARELRRDWLTEILSASDYQRYATAHHLDDQNETFFINLLRGSGIRGLHGILPQQGPAIHPLMFAWRHDIEHYARERGLPYREDSSNQKTDYLRNKIRHHLLPLLTDLNPAFSSSLNETIQRLRKAEKVYNDHIRDCWERVADTSRDTVLINGQEVLKLREAQTCLFEFLKPYGFSPEDADRILKILPQGSGQQFLSPSHRLIVDRETILISEKRENQYYDSNRLFIQKEDRKVQQPVPLELSLRAAGPGFQIDPSPTLAQFDADTVRFPLEIRHWRQGDRFVPLGMEGSKLISDYFVDEKFSRFGKEKSWLLLSGGEVIWIIGHRMDDRFKITPETRKVLEIKLTHPDSG